MSPEETKRVELYLQKMFGCKDIKVMARQKKNDSVEVLVRDEFVGIVFKDDEDNEVTYQFQMAILEDDLNQ